MGDIDVLETVLAKDVALIDGVSADQLDAETPCPDFDVQALLDHITGWVQVFAAAANGRVFEGDPKTFHSQDPAADFRAAADDTVAGWRAGGLDREVRLTGSAQPAQDVLSMTLMEYVAHGCDLAAATGQAVPFSEAELAVALDRARATLPDQYRGEGMPFGHRIEVPDDAPVLDRFLGFMGREVPEARG